MSKSGQTISDERPPASLERGEVLSSIKRWALLGYRQEVRGSEDEDFERSWREAFHADEPADTEVDTEGSNSA